MPPQRRPAPDAAARCPVVLDPAGHDLHGEAAALRGQGPAVRVELPAGVLAWSVTRHDVIKALTTDPRVSRDHLRHWPGLAELPDGWPMAGIALHRSFFNAYGEEHHRLRARIAPSFSPRRVARLRPQVTATTERLIDALAALPPGTGTDLRAALSRPLTMTVICDLFGVPERMREPLGSAIDAFIDTSTTDPEQVHADLAELNARLAELLAHKEAHPGADLASDLLAPSPEGEPALSDENRRDTLFLMIGAGYETGVNLITSATLALLTHPEHLARARAGGLAWPDVVEETLRHEAPIMHVPLRYAIEDIDLGEGVTIRKGEPIIVAFAAAGRDPALHPEAADTFDPTRAAKDHLAFGHGPHFCLGAHLARLEAEVALRALFTRFPALTLAEPGGHPARLPSLIFNGPAALRAVPVPAR